MEARGISALAGQAIKGLFNKRKSQEAIPLTELEIHILKRLTQAYIGLGEIRSVHYTWIAQGISVSYVELDEACQALADRGLVVCGRDSVAIKEEKFNKLFDRRNR